MHIRNPLTIRSGIFLSSVLLVMPLLCWFAVFMYVLFGQVYFMDHIFTKVAGISPFITLSILIGFPMLAMVVVNLGNMDLLLTKTNSVFRGSIKLNPGAFSGFLSLLSLLLVIVAVFVSF